MKECLKFRFIIIDEGYGRRFILDSDLREVACLLEIMQDVTCSTPAGVVSEKRNDFL
jgi:hypothetical protein